MLINFLNLKKLDLFKNIFLQCIAKRNKFSTEYRNRGKLKDKNRVNIKIFNSHLETTVQTSFTFFLPFLLPLPFLVTKNKVWYYFMKDEYLCCLIL